MSETFPVPEGPRASGPYTAAGGQLQFAENFPIQNGRDVAVYRTRGGARSRLALSTDYSILSVGGSGFTVELVQGAVAGDVIDIEGLAHIQRTTSVVANGKVAGAIIDRELDRSRIIEQELRRDVNGIIGRAIAIPRGSTATPDAIINAVLRLDPRLLAPSATPPLTRADGSALQRGDEYFDTTLDQRRIRTATGTWRDTVVDGTVVAGAWTPALELAGGIQPAHLSSTGWFRRIGYHVDIGFVITFDSAVLDSLFDTYIRNLPIVPRANAVADAASGFMLPLNVVGLSNVEYRAAFGALLSGSNLMRIVLQPLDGIVGSSPSGARLQGLRKSDVLTSETIRISGQGVYEVTP